MGFLPFSTDEDIFQVSRVTTSFSVEVCSTVTQAAVADNLHHSLCQMCIRDSDKAVDVRNFHKKIAMMEYVVPLEEKHKGVAHRAARYYKFDKKIYNKVRR